MIKVQLHSGLGNQLFQYTFARYASGKLKTVYLLYFNNKCKYKLNYFRISVYWRILFFSKYSQRLFNWIFRKIILKNENVQLDSALTFEIDNLNNHCQYYGYFQSIKYLDNDLNKIRKSLQVKSKYKKLFLKKYPFFSNYSTLVIHLRFGDYIGKVTTVENKKVEWKLPEKWYLDALRQVLIEYDYTVIVSDKPKFAQEILKLDRNNIIYSNENEIIDFQCIMNADCCIISNSTYAWWAALLNKKPGKRILAPKNWVGHNAGFEYPQGIMTKEFIWI